MANLRGEARTTVSTRTLIFFYTAFAALWVVTTIWSAVVPRPRRMLFTILYVFVTAWMTGMAVFLWVKHGP